MNLYLAGVNDKKNSGKKCKQYSILVEAYSVVQAKHRAIAICREEYKYNLRGDYLKVGWIKERMMNKC